MTELSPAAQAVMEAYWDTPNEPITTQIHQAAVAAALRAAVYHTRKRKYEKMLGVVMNQSQYYCLESDILAIAAELEGAND